MGGIWNQNVRRWLSSCCFYWFWVNIRRSHSCEVCETWSNASELPLIKRQSQRFELTFTTESANKIITFILNLPRAHWVKSTPLLASSSASVPFLFSQPFLILLEESYLHLVSKTEHLIDHICQIYSIIVPALIIVLPCLVQFCYLLIYLVKQSQGGGFQKEARVKVPLVLRRRVLLLQWYLTRWLSIWTVLSTTVIRASKDCRASSGTATKSYFWCFEWIDPTHLRGTLRHSHTAKRECGARTLNVECGVTSVCIQLPFEGGLKVRLIEI